MMLPIDNDRSAHDRGLVDSSLAMKTHQAAYCTTTQFITITGIKNLHHQLGPARQSIHDHLMAAVPPNNRYERILQAVDISMTDPSKVLLTCSQKQFHSAKMLAQALPLILKEHYGEASALEAITQEYMDEAESTFTKHEGQYMSRQAYLQSQHIAILNALTYDDEAMAAKVEALESTMISTAATPELDLISNMEFLWSAQMTPEGTLQRTSVASKMAPSVAEASAASKMADTVEGASVVSKMADSAAGSALTRMEASVAGTSQGLSKSEPSESPSAKKMEISVEAAKGHTQEAKQAGAKRDLDEESLASDDLQDLNAPEPAHIPVPLPGTFTSWTLAEEDLPPLPAQMTAVYLGPGDLRYIREKAVLMMQDKRPKDKHCWVHQCLYAGSPDVPLIPCQHCDRWLHPGCGCKLPSYKLGDKAYIYCHESCKYMPFCAGDYLDPELTSKLSETA